MSVSVEALEGRLLAQRKILARILMQLGDTRLDEFLSARDHFDGGDEDPGSEPDPSYAVEAALAEELRSLAEEVERLRTSQA